MWMYLILFVLVGMYGNVVAVDGYINRIISYIKSLLNLFLLFIIILIITFFIICLLELADIRNRVSK
jgi:hypothetical protein